MTWLSLFLLAQTQTTPPGTGPVVGQEELLDRVVAIVGDEPITMAELENMFMVYAAQLPPGTDETEAKKRILEEMINQKLLYIQAKSDTEIVVTPEEIDQALNQQIEGVKQQLGQEAFEAQLKAEGITEEQLPDLLRENVKMSLYIQKLIELRIKPNIVITTDEVKAYYDAHKDSVAVEPAQYRLSHILVRIEASGPAEQEAYNKAKGIYKQLLAGADFADMAARYSDDRQTATKGGEIGWMPVNYLSPDIAKALAKLEPGGLTKPVRGELGYHIFQMINKRPDAYYLRHIVVNVQPEKADSARAMRTVKKILKLSKTRKFSDLAKKYSQDPTTKELGGDLGWIPENAMTPEILEAVKDAKPGDVVGPVNTPLGYTVIKVDDKKEKVVHPFEDVSEFIKAMLYQQKVQEKLDQLIERIKTRVYVETRL